MSKRQKLSSTPYSRQLVKRVNRNWTTGLRVPRLLSSMPHGLGARGETKVVDLLTAVYACDTTGTITPINLVAAGSSYNNRIGRKIAMKSVYLNGSLSPQGAASGETYCRIMIVYDAQPNGALPVYADIVLGQAAVLATTASTSRDNLNLNNRDRFRVLLDKRIVMPALVGSVIVNPNFPTATEVNLNEFRKLYRLETNYKADTAGGAIGDIATGSLLLVTFGDNAAGAGYSLSATVRLRFTDN